MKKLGLALLPAVLLVGCASEPASEPVAESTPTVASAPSLPMLTSDQISTLAANLRAVDPAAVEGAFDNAQAVCLQLSDGAHGEGFYRGVALRFGVEDPSKGEALVEAIQSAGVCG